MIKVGVTGGIGSGKTTVCQIFSTLNVPVYNADLEARILSDTHPEIVNNVSQLFGNDIYDQGKLNRKKVGMLVFSNKELLQKLNAIIHPVVASHFEQWLNLHSAYPYILKEAAILFESGGDKQVDKIIAIAAPLKIRIKRVMLRDNLSEEEVLKRINNQMSQEEKIKRSDYVINSNEIDLVVPQVVELHKQILSEKLIGEN